MSYIKVETKEGFVHITLNRPEVRNAFNAELIAELSQVFSDLETREDDICGVVLRGEGKSFSAGADLRYMQSMVDYNLEENQEDSINLFEMFQSIRQCQFPVISYVHGHVMGGALGLVACSDITIAENLTQFCFSEVKLGLAPAVISAFVLDRIPGGFVRDLMLTGEVFNTERALNIGLIHYRGEELQAENYLTDTLAQFRECGSEAVRATKRLLNQVPYLDWEQRRSSTAQVIAERRVSDEGQEGLRAFLEKRQPVWRK